MAAEPTSRAYDVLLRGGVVVDGLGATPRRADVAVRDDRIAEVAVLPREVRADVELDVSDHYVFPGFVDTHIHADAMVFAPQMQLAALRQGVTTLMLGQDGVSFAPSDKTTAEFVDGYFGAINGKTGCRGEGCSVAGLLSLYDGATPFNVAYLAPHGTIRHRVLGTAERLPDAGELRSMLQLLSDALADGAFGISTGLEYLPGRHADVLECSTLCSMVAAAGGVHVTHLRGYDDDAYMHEVCTIAVASGCPTHLSHYRSGNPGPKHPIDAALSRGIDLSFDSYPYLRSSTLLALSTLPLWVQAEGPVRAVERLQDRRVRDRLRREWFPTLRLELDEVVLSYVPAHDWAWAEGLSVVEAATTVGADVPELLCDLFVACALEVGSVNGPRPSTTEAHMRWLLRHPVHMAGSDGIYLGSRPHPRGWGTFARYLGRHTRELGDYSWAEAAQHLAARAAQRFGFADRGVLRRGAYADIAVVDPGTVRDEATYESPRRLARGVNHVLVNGSIVLRDTEPTEVTPGLALRRNG